MEYAYYPGCSLESTGRPYDVSLRLVFERLGIGLREIEDWNCCGATSYISMNKLTAYALSARNLAYAERMGMRRLRAVQLLLHDPLEGQPAHALGRGAQATNLNEVLARGRALLLGARSRCCTRWASWWATTASSGSRSGSCGASTACAVAPYYGCQIVRPHGRFDDREDPQQLDNLLAAVGATVVPFPSKVRCCGGMLMTTCEEVALRPEPRRSCRRPRTPAPR